MWGASAVLWQPELICPQTSALVACHTSAHLRMMLQPNDIAPNLGRFKKVVKADSASLGLDDGRWICVGSVIR